MTLWAALGESVDLQSLEGLWLGGQSLRGIDVVEEPRVSFLMVPWGLCWRETFLMGLSIGGNSLCPTL